MRLLPLWAASLPSAGAPQPTARFGDLFSVGSGPRTFSAVALGVLVWIGGQVVRQPVPKAIEVQRDVDFASVARDI